MVFAGKWRMADVRRAPLAGGGDDGGEGGRCPAQLLCRLFLPSTCEFGSKIISTSGRGMAYGRLLPHKQPDLVSDLFRCARP